MGPSSMTPALLTTVSSRPNSCHRALHHGPGRGLVGDVGLDHQHVGVVADAARRGPPAGRAGGRRRPPWPLGGQGHRGGLADAARCPGDQGHGSLQATGHESAYWAAVDRHDGAVSIVNVGYDAVVIEVVRHPGTGVAADAVTRDGPADLVASSVVMRLVVLLVDPECHRAAVAAGQSGTSADGRG